MANTNRIDSFSGTTEAYISYLETLVKTYREQGSLSDSLPLATSGQSPASEPTTPLSSRSHSPPSPETNTNLLNDRVSSPSLPLRTSRASVSRGPHSTDRRAPHSNNSSRSSSNRSVARRQVSRASADSVNSTRDSSLPPSPPNAVSSPRRLPHGSEVPEVNARNSKRTYRSLNEDTADESTVRRRRSPSTEDEASTPARQRVDKELDNFLKDVPPMRHWISKRQEASLESVRENRQATRILLGLGARDDDRVTQEANGSSLLDLAEVYFKHCQKVKATGKWYTRMHHFTSLVAISWCQVLVKAQHPVHEVDSMMKRVLKNEQHEERTLRRLRSGAVWVSKCITSLADAGWGDRATEIFLLCDRSLTQYLRFSERRDSLEVLRSELLMDTDRDIVECEAWMPYSIPCLIKYMAGSSLRMDQICEALGYDKVDISTLYEKMKPKYDSLSKPNDQNINSGGDDSGGRSDHIGDQGSNQLLSQLSPRIPFESDIPGLFLDELGSIE